MTSEEVIVNDSDNSFKIPRSALLSVLHGVAAATKTSENQLRAVVLWLSSQQTSSSSVSTFFHQRDTHNRDNSVETPVALSLIEWRSAIVSRFHEEHLERQHAFLSLGVAFLREKIRDAISDVTDAVSADELAQVWELIHEALTNPPLQQPCNANRSAQGFLAIPLCSLLSEGRIDELYRLHVWLPDGQRGKEDSVHSHQPFAQSWILAGEGTDHSYRVEPAVDYASATHAEYALTWSDAKGSGTAYKTHQTHSTIVNTGSLVRATHAATAVHGRNASYTIHAAAFHRTEVQPDAFHATLFFFDASRGFVEDARVLGPKNGESFTQPRDSAGVSSAALAVMVSAFRLYERFMDQGRQCAPRGEWEHALQAYNSALAICESTKDFPNPVRYRRLVLGGLGNTNRRFGRYEQAKYVLEEALAGMGPSLQRVKLNGELGVVYRHMGRIDDAKRAFEQQFDTAKQLENELSMCRATGNLGMINYQLFLHNHDEVHLNMAVDQLKERIRLARQIKTPKASASAPKAHWFKLATTWEAIGLARLSLCFTIRGNVKEAVSSALRSLEVISSAEDNTVTAISRFFYGRALLMSGERHEALEQFNLRNTCTPAMAFCKEPSEEHRQYLAELVDAGADFGLEDEHGYTALDMAVFNNDAVAESIVLHGLRQALDGDVEQKITQLQKESKLRKGYRELFQEKLRPTLLSSSPPFSGLQNMRRSYANALASDEEKREVFDTFKVLRYIDFSKCGKIPHSRDGIAQDFILESDDLSGIIRIDFVIFFSYRWINKSGGVSSPDDAQRTQYQRMIAATEEYLKLYPSIDREKLGVWVVSYCSYLNLALQSI